MDDSIKIFNCYFVLFLILICFPVSRCTNTSTICYGISGLSCITHRLSCISPLVILIINTTYGYRPGCNNIIGLSTCINTTCCNEEPGDCFKEFSSEENQKVAKCNGVQSCKLSNFRRYNTTHTVCNGSVISAYSKVEYDCVLKGLTTIAQTREISTSKVTKAAEETATTTHFSRDLTSSTFSSTLSSQCVVSQSDNSGVVGGVLGTLLIISVIINVGLIVYFTRNMKSLSTTQRENNYDGLTNPGRDQTLPTYDVLQVQSVASSDNDDKKKLDSSHTYYNTKGDSLSRDIDPYYENMKKP